MRTQDFRPLPCMGLARGLPKIVVALEIKPKLRARVKGFREAQYHIRRYRTALIDNLGESFARNVERLHGRRSGKMERFQIVPFENPSRMRRPTISFNHRFL